MLSKLPFQKGLILLNKNTILENGVVKPKFFILMEEPLGRFKTSILFMTTTKRTDLLEDIKKRGVMIDLPIKGKKRSLVLTNIYHEISTKEVSKHSRMGRLRSSQIQELENRIIRSSLPEEVKNRVLFKKPKEEKRVTFKLFDAQQVTEIKSKLNISE